MTDFSPSAGVSMDCTTLKRPAESDKMPQRFDYKIAIRILTDTGILQRSDDFKSLKKTIFVTGAAKPLAQRNLADAWSNQIAHAQKQNFPPSHGVSMDCITLKRPAESDKMPQGFDS
jgi:hypothetical protein